ncbi:MAG: tetratricopeptide repeat protein [Methylococcaceae bacterium]|nr:tetratricopeptide repeat protein [Methylococcaceae bacterium]
MRRLLALFFLLALPALAAEPAGSEPKIDVSAEVLKEFQAIEALTAKGSLGEATQRGQALLPKLQDAPAARALLLRNLALLYGQQKHYLHAATLLQQSLDLHTLSAEDAARAQLDMAQYYVAAADYPKAAASLSAWLAQAKAPQPEQFLLLAEIRGELKQYTEAAEVMERLIARSPAPKPEWLQRAAQYYAAAENYPKAAALLSASLEQTPAPKPEQFLLLAEIQTRLKHYTEAARSLEKLIARSPEPKPEWYQMLLGLYHEDHNLEGCIQVLGHLLRQDAGNPLYWEQLMGIYQEAKQEQKALAVRQLMYTRGLLTKPDEIVQLVQVLRYQGLSARAADILQREIDKGGVEKNPRNLGLLAEAWTEARELGKAAATLEKSVAMADTGETLHRLGQIYSELHDWARARQALARALTRGGLKNPGGAWLLLGMANYRLNGKNEAREAFLQAKNTPAVSKTAEQWLEHIDREAQQGKRPCCQQHRAAGMGVDHVDRKAGQKQDRRH